MKRKRDGKLLDELLDQMRRRRNVTKARAGWKRGRGAPDELEGVGEAFSCSFEPFHQKYDFRFTKKHVKLDLCSSFEHLASLVWRAFPPPLSFPPCLGSFDLVAFSVPGSPWQTNMIGFHHRLGLNPPQCPGNKLSRWRQRSGFSPF